MAGLPNQRPLLHTQEEFKEPSLIIVSGWVFISARALSLFRDSCKDYSRLQDV